MMGNSIHHDTAAGVTKALPSRVFHHMPAVYAWCMVCVRHSCVVIRMGTWACVLAHGTLYKLFVVFSGKARRSQEIDSWLLQETAAVQEVTVFDVWKRVWRCWRTTLEDHTLVTYLLTAVQSRQEGVWSVISPRSNRFIHRSSAIEWANFIRQIVLLVQYVCIWVKFILQVNHSNNACIMKFFIWRLLFIPLSSIIQPTTKATSISCNLPPL